MQNPSLNALVLIAITALSTAASAQNVYKCGDTYSQLPCPGGVVVDATDQRTSAQKAQSDLATGRDARTAEAMEKARLQQEKIDLAANTPRVKPASPDKAKNTQTSPAKKRKQASKKRVDKKGVAPHPKDELSQSPKSQ